MALLIFTSILALFAIAIAVVPAAVILWRDAHRVVAPRIPAASSVAPAAEAALADAETFAHAA